MLLSRSATPWRIRSDVSARARPPCGPISSAYAVAASERMEIAGNEAAIPAVAPRPFRKARLLIAVSCLVDFIDPPGPKVLELRQSERCEMKGWLTLLENHHGKLYLCLTTVPAFRFRTGPRPFAQTLGATP